MKIIITIPAYNEESTIGTVIQDIKQTMSQTKYDYEIIVVDDGSTDRTAENARKAGAIVFSHPYNYGLAETFRTEMEKALQSDADIIVHIDADNQYRANEIPKLIEPVEKGEADLVLGSRFMGTIEEMPVMKRWGNIAFSKVVSQISGIKITDAQTGFRAFTREFAEKVRIISTHTYTQEMVIRAVKEKFKVKEVPVYFAKREKGKSRLISNPVEYAIKAWINIFRIYRDYEPLKFFGSMGVTLISASFIICIYILCILFIEGWVGIDRRIPTILLAVLLFVSGIQILFFGFLADKVK